MDPINKKALTEADICELFISPAIKQAGWDMIKQVRREVTLAPGPIIVRGNSASRDKKKKKFADYVLYWERGVPVAVVEAKDNNHTISQGMQQALGYAELLNVPCAFASNGDAFAAHNKTAAAGEDIETEIPLNLFPAPPVLWQRYRQYRGIPETGQKLILEPFHQEAAGKEPRYYQADAVNRVIEAVSRGQTRILLVMATGTGKTYTAFQIIWRLWKAKSIKRVLYLVDRNFLADPPLLDDFKPFGKAMIKVKRRRIDPSYEIYLALYQAVTGPEEKGKIFKKLTPGFFDLVIVDECHRGSAAEDSVWREILEYFSGAIQLGMTATPKETKYVSNITYFNQPVYTYSLKQGMDDGFLAPYKVIRIDIDKDIYGWTPPPGMTDDLGQPIEARTYNQADMDRILVLNQRTRLVAKRVMQYLTATDPYAKTIIFCEDIDHAERMRKAIVNAAGALAVNHPRYVMRITGDSPEGKLELGNFIDPASQFPVIATTSELLTTGLNVKTCKLIVLDKTINSMTMFKQIIGRGTRVEEDYNKYFFTIMDFKKATELFRDPDFDGEPVVIYEPGPDDSPVPPEPPPDEDEPDDFMPQAGKKIVVSGVPAIIIAERIQYYRDGALITESYRDFSRKRINEAFTSLGTFLASWNAARKKQEIINQLEERGIYLDSLAEEVGRDYGDFDLICHIAYDQPPLTRKERANNVRKRNYFTKYGAQARAVIDALLDKYADEDISGIESPTVLKLKPFSDIGTPKEIINDIFGGKAEYESTIAELERELFNLEKAA